MSDEPKEGWHYNIGDATGEAVRFAEMAGQPTRVVKVTAYLVTAHDELYDPPGGEVVFTATGTVSDHERPEEPDELPDDGEPF